VAEAGGISTVARGVGDAVAALRAWLGKPRRETPPADARDSTSVQPDHV